MAIEGAKFRAPVEPGCLLRLEVEFVQKRTSVCKFAGTALGRRQARRRSAVHGDDRGSAGRLIRQPFRSALDPEDSRSARWPAVAWRAFRRIRLAAGRSAALGRNGAAGRGRGAKRSARATGRPHAVLAAIRGSAGPNRDRGSTAARRAAAGAAAAASARARSTRARSPVDSWFDRPLGEGVQFELVEQFARCGPGQAPPGRAR